MKAALGLILAFAFAVIHVAQADTMIGAGILGVDCPKGDRYFYNNEMENAANQAAYMCFAMSLSGVSPGSVLDLCAGVRNDENRPAEEVGSFVRAVKTGGQELGANEGLRLTGGAKPNNQIQRSLANQLGRASTPHAYAKNREAVLERLQRDLRNARELCAEVPRFERNEILRRYKWDKVSQEPGAKALHDCRAGLKAMRQAKAQADLDPLDESIIALLETTQRFADRVRGLTLQTDPAQLNFLDLHHMAKQAYETLDKRVRFLSPGKSPSHSELKDFGEDDPDFANALACHEKVKADFAIMPVTSQAQETFKLELLEKFVNTHLRDNKFTINERQAITREALEELTYLIGSDQFQRAIWFYEDKTDSLEMREFFEKAIKGKKFSKVELIAMVKNKGLGVNESYRVTLPNGVQGIFKPFKHTDENPRHRENFYGELAVNEIDKVLELRVVPVSLNIFVDGREGSFQLFVTNALTPASMDISKAVQMGEGVAQKTWQVNLLDCTALNPDRQNNIANIMVTIPEHRRVAIDNGLAFTARKDFPVLELLHPKADSSAFIPQDLGERKFLSKRLDKLIDLLKTKTLQLHDDDRLNQCAKMIANAVATTFKSMIVKCGSRSNKDCNSLGADEYKTLIDDRSFIGPYNTLRCGS